jgi:hypothetical protein
MYFLLRSSSVYTSPIQVANHLVVLNVLRDDVFDVTCFDSSVPDAIRVHNHISRKLVA